MMAANTLLDTFLILIVLQYTSAISTEIKPDVDIANVPKNFTSDETSKVLSRRKRFLTFPDGSSFQLVKKLFYSTTHPLTMICTQNIGYLQLGTVIFFGTTAALAWPLPTDPESFNILLKGKDYHAQNRMDTKHVVYFDEAGKVLAKVPYGHRTIIVSPAFAKRSAESTTINKETIESMHKHSLVSDVKDNMVNVEFHRFGRRTLYPKMETLFDSLGWPGRACVLQLLCEYGSGKRRQGAFVEEIFEAIFTLPGGQEFKEDEHKEYDKAHRTSKEDSCTKKYPDCIHPETGRTLFDNSMEIIT